MRKIIPVLMIMLLLPILSFANNKKIDITYLETKNVDQFDWNNISPLDFINILKRENAYMVTIWEMPSSNWIKKEHIHELMKLVDSSEPAAHVISSYSSYMPSGPSSTVGAQAIFLIEGFMNKKYPPALWSKHVDPKKIEEIKKWYDTFINKN